MLPKIRKSLRKSLDSILCGTLLSTGNIIMRLELSFGLKPKPICYIPCIEAIWVYWNYLFITSTLGVDLSEYLCFESKFSVQPQFCHTSWSHPLCRNTDKAKNKFLNPEIRWKELYFLRKLFNYVSIKIPAHRHN